MRRLLLIAGLDVPPPVTWIETRLGFVELRRVPLPDGIRVTRIVIPFHSRAPPVA